MTLSAVSRLSFGIAALDMFLAFVLASAGDSMCFWFAILGGLMTAHGLYYYDKVHKE